MAHRSDIVTQNDVVGPKVSAKHVEWIKEESGDVAPARSIRSGNTLGDPQMAELDQHGSAQKLADQCRRFLTQEQSPITNSLKKLRQALDNIPADVIRTGSIDERERKIGKILGCRHIIALFMQTLSFRGIFDDTISPDGAVPAPFHACRIHYRSPNHFHSCACLGHRNRSAFRLGRVDHSFSHGAPAFQAASSTALSRSVSMLCQKPKWR